MVDRQAWIGLAHAVSGLPAGATEEQIGEALDDLIKSHERSIAAWRETAIKRWLEGTHD